MSRVASSASLPAPAVFLSAWRRCWLLLVLLLAGCGEDAGQTLRRLGVPEVAPASLAYATPQALYVTGEAITANAPVVTGGTPSAFSVAPALPAGLVLDPRTGVLSGTPTALQRQASYTVTARNSAGAVQAPLQITVTARGSWTSTAAIPSGRHYFAMVRLPSGKALAIGGFTNAGITSSVVLYDPATGTWTAAASMLNPRSDPSATLLQDGRVLVVGGDVVATGNTSATAEIYDPVTNTWTATASMGEPRVRHTATLLPDGKVLVIGGYSLIGSLTFSQTAERYDPAAGTWAPLTTRLSVARGQHAAELLPGGNAVVVIAGVNRNGFVTSAELFPVDDSGSTTAVTGAVAGGNVYSSVRLGDGSVLAMGDGSTTAWRFHPATATWTTSTFASLRLLPTLTLLADGRVLMAGGHNLATAEIYNPDVNAWTTAASMATARRSAAAVLLEDGKVLVAGGFNNTSSSLDGAELYQP